MPDYRDSRSNRSHNYRHRHRSKSSSDSGYDRRRQKRAKDDDDSERVGEQSRKDDRRNDYRGMREGERDYRRRRSESPRERGSERRYRDRQHRDHDEDRKRRSSRSPLSKEGLGKKQKLIGDSSTSRKQAGPLPSQADSFSLNKDPSTALTKDEDATIEKQKPNIAPTGILAAVSNTVATGDGAAIVLKYHEPSEARKPPARDQWKLFVFKGAEIVETIELGTRSCWLIGREIAVVDLPAEHPSISKQHAVIQFRFIEKRNEYGDKVGKVKPYIIDLDSANGSKLNKEDIPGSRYLELRDKDMIQFGHSTREYVLMLPPKD